MAVVPRPRSRAQIAQRLQRSVGQLATASLARMERDMPWVTDLSAQERSWIGMIVQAGITSFVDWYRDPGTLSPLRAEVFGAAPRALTRTITLQQTVELVRLSIEVVEENVAEVVGESDAVAVRAAIDSYAREVAFATAEVYARAAEQRGAWDARLEALVVDAVLRGDRDESISSRASALGWDGTGNVVVVVGGLREGNAIEQVRRLAHDRGLDCLCAVQDDRLVVVLGGVSANGEQTVAFASAFAPGPVVVGPVVPGLTDASLSAQAAQSGLRAAHGWADAPRPVHADDLLPERALIGDDAARQRLVSDVHAPLAEAGEVVLETVRTYLDAGSSMEATGRALFVHPNTVRYRLKRAGELTGLTPSNPRDAFTLRVALTLGRLAALATEPSTL
jgi:sugar diacid utilization regulator